MGSNPMAATPVRQIVAMTVARLSAFSILYYWMVRIWSTVSMLTIQ